MDPVLTKAALLAAAAAGLPRERVQIPELGGDVYVRALSGKERDAWEKSNYIMRRGRAEPRLDNARARLAVRTLVDEAGHRLFDDTEAELLGGLNAAVLSRIYETAQRLSNVTEEDIEELKKSSASADGSASPTS